MLWSLVEDFTEYPFASPDVDNIIYYNPKFVNNTCFDDVYTYVLINYVNTNNNKYTSKIFKTETGSTFTEINLNISEDDYGGLHIYNNSSGDIYFYYRIGNTFYRKKLLNGSFSETTELSLPDIAFDNINNYQVSFAGDNEHYLLEVQIGTNVNLYYYNSSWSAIPNITDCSDSIFTTIARGACMIFAKHTYNSVNKYFYTQNIKTGSFSTWGDLDSGYSATLPIMFTDIDGNINLIYYQYIPSTTYGKIKYFSWFGESLGSTLTGFGEPQPNTWHDVIFEFTNSGELYNQSFQYRPMFCKSRDGIRHIVSFVIYDKLSDNTFGTSVCHSMTIDAYSIRDYIHYMVSYPGLKYLKTHQNHISVPTDINLSTFKLSFNTNGSYVITQNSFTLSNPETLFIDLYTYQPTEYTPRYSIAYSNYKYTPTCNYIFIDTYKWNGIYYNGFYITDIAYAKSLNPVTLSTNSTIKFDTKQFNLDQNSDLNIYIAEYTSNPVIETFYFSGSINDLDTNIILNTPILIPSNSVNPKLRFMAKFNIEDNYDYLYVMISANGTDWDIIDTKTGDFFTLTEYIYDLTSYVGSSIYIRFRHTTDESYFYDGVYINEISIYDDSGNLFLDNETSSNWTMTGGFSQVIIENQAWQLLDTISSVHDFTNRSYDISSFDNKQVLFKFEFVTNNYRNCFYIKNVEFYSDMTLIESYDLNNMEYSYCKISNDDIYEWNETVYYPDSTWLKQTKNDSLISGDYYLKIEYIFHYYLAESDKVDIFISNIKLYDSNSTLFEDSCSNYNNFYNNNTSIQLFNNISITTPDSISLFVIEPTFNQIIFGINSSISINGESYYYYFTTKTFPENNGFIINPVKTWDRYSFDRIMYYIGVDVVPSNRQYKVIKSSDGIIYCMYKMSYISKVSTTLEEKYKFYIFKSIDNGYSWTDLEYDNFSYDYLHTGIAIAQDISIISDGSNGIYICHVSYTALNTRFFGYHYYDGTNFTYNPYYSTQIYFYIQFAITPYQRPPCFEVINNDKYFLQFQSSTSLILYEDSNSVLTSLYTFTLSSYSMNYDNILVKTLKIGNDIYILFLNFRITTSSIRLFKFDYDTKTISQITLPSLDSYSYYGLGNCIFLNILDKIIIIHESTYNTKNGLFTLQYDINTNAVNLYHTRSTNIQYYTKPFDEYYIDENNTIYFGEIIGSYINKYNKSYIIKSNDYGITWSSDVINSYFGYSTSDSSDFSIINYDLATNIYSGIYINEFRQTYSLCWLNAPTPTFGEKAKLNYYMGNTWKRARSIKVITGTGSGSNRYNFNIVSSLKNDDYVYGAKTVLSNNPATDSYGTTTARITTSEVGKNINSRVVNTCAEMFQDLLGWTVNHYCDDSLTSNLDTNYASLTKNGISIRMARSTAVQKIINVSVRLPSNESTHAFYMGELFFYIDSGNYTVKFKVIDGLNGQYMLPFSDANSAYPLYRDFSATRIHDGQEVFVVKGCISDATKVASTEQSLLSAVHGNGYYFMGYNAVMMAKRYFCQDTPSNKVYSYVADNIYYGKLTNTFPSYEVFSVNGITYARFDYYAYKLD